MLIKYTSKFIHIFTFFKKIIWLIFIIFVIKSNEKFYLYINLIILFKN